MSNTCVVVVDQQPYWLEFATDTLRSASYTVLSYDAYHYLLSCEDTPDWPEQPPGLVILGCASIGPAEQKTIEHLQALKCPVLVLCAFLPWQMMRELFLQGVDDVADKTYSSKGLLLTVKETLASIKSRNNSQEERITL